MAKMSKAEKEEMVRGFRELEKEKLNCPVPGCTSFFTLKRNLVRHLRVQHNSQWSCESCRETFNRYDNFILHQRVCKFKSTGKRPAPKDILYVGGALDDVLADYTLDLQNENQQDIMNTLYDSVFKLKTKLEEGVGSKQAVKFYVSLIANFHLASNPTFFTEPPPCFNSKPLEVLQSTDLDEVLYDTTNQLTTQIEEFQQRRSGWVLDKLLRLDLHVAEYNPLRTSSYIPLPAEIANKKAVINIQNKKDEKCFLWSVIAGTFLKDTKLHDPQRPAQYRK